MCLFVVVVVSINLRWQWVGVNDEQSGKWLLSNDYRTYNELYCLRGGVYIYCYADYVCRPVRRRQNLTVCCGLRACVGLL